MSRSRKSAGVVLYRRRGGRLEVLLVHPGGPYWTKKDAGAWSIPKGEVDDDEDALLAARREFFEETGVKLDGDFAPLRALRQRSGKVIHAWALEGDADAESMHSNAFSMEWPPRSGQLAEFPEVDKAAWLALDEARLKLIAGQLPFLDELEALVAARGAS